MIMNKIYKLIWNESVQAWVSVSELSPSRGKKAKVIGEVKDGKFVVSYFKLLPNSIKK